MSGGIAVQFLLTVGRIYSPGNPARWLLGVADKLGVPFEIKSQALPPSCWTKRYRTTLRAWNNVVGFILVSLWAFRSLSRQGQALRVAFGEPWPLTAPHPAFHQDKPHACSCGWTSPLAPHSEPQSRAIKIALTHYGKIATHFCREVCDAQGKDTIDIDFLAKIEPINLAEGLPLLDLPPARIYGSELRPSPPLRFTRNFRLKNRQNTRKFASI